MSISDAEAPGLTRKQLTLQKNENNIEFLKGTIEINRPLMNLFSKLNASIEKCSSFPKKQEWAPICKALQVIVGYLSKPAEDIFPKNVKIDAKKLEDFSVKRKRDIEYSLKRLVRGMSSSGVSIRMVFSLGLKQLVENGLVSSESLLDAMNSILAVDEIEKVLGRLGLYTMFFRNFSANVSDIWLKDLFNDCSESKIYLREAFGRVLYDYYRNLADTRNFSTLLQQYRSTENTELQGLYLISENNNPNYSAAFSKVASETFFCQPRLHFTLEFALEKWTSEEDLCKLWNDLKGKWVESTSFEKKYSALVFLDHLLAKFPLARAYEDIFQGINEVLKAWAHKPTNILYKKTMDTLEKFHLRILESEDFSSKICVLKRGCSKDIFLGARHRNLEIALSLPIMKEALKKGAKLLWDDIVTARILTEDQEKNLAIESGSEVESDEEDSDDEEALSDEDTEEIEVDSESVVVDVEANDVNESELEDSEINQYYDDNAEVIDAKLSQLFRAKRFDFDLQDDSDSDEGRKKKCINAKKRIARIERLNKRKIPVSLRLSLQEILLPLIIFCVSEKTSIKLQNFRDSCLPILNQSIIQVQNKLVDHFGEPCITFSETWWKWLTSVILVEPAAALVSNPATAFDSINEDSAGKLKQLVQKDSKSIVFLNEWIKTF